MPNPAQAQAGPTATLALPDADWISGGDDSLVSTCTLTVLEWLSSGDQVYVTTSIKGSGTYYMQSGLASSHTRAIYFTGQKIAE